MPGPVLVTGAGGFVGRHLTVLLGADLVAFEGDVTEADALRAAVRRSAPRAVVHLAALASVADSWRGPTEVWRVNVLGTVNVLAAVEAEQPAARVLVVSSGEVYGRAEQVPTDEEAAPRPVSPYAASKAAGEIAAGRAARAVGLDVVVARPFAHVGPGQDERFAVGSWTRQIAALERAGGGTLLVGDLGARRDLSDVRDVCRAYAALLDGAVPAGTYNVASGHAVSMREVVDVLVGLARVPIRVEQDPRRLRPSDVPVVCGSAERLRRVTGWQPVLGLRESLADALEQAREQADTSEVG